MNPATEILIRRAACQAASLARQQARSVFTDRTPARAANANILTADVAPTDEVISAPSVPKQKTMADLPGPDGYPVLGTAPEYFRKSNRGQMHEVQVGSVYV